MTGWRETLIVVSRFRMSATAPLDNAPARHESNELPAHDWAGIALTLLTSRKLDDLEEKTLVPQKKILYQFSARGHELSQILLAQRLTHPHDAVTGYYRSRPMVLSLGMPIEDALSSCMAKEGGYSNGRDIGAVFNFPNPGGPTALPMCGGVGAQYTPAAGWAQAIDYRRKVLGDVAYEGAIAVAHGGEASVATNGFWAALTIATTLRLPMLFFIEDNGFGISVTSDFQTPGANIAENLASFKNLKIHDGDGTDPKEAGRMIDDAVLHMRGGHGPALLRLTVPRLNGHSAQDTQAYKSDDHVAAEWARDPLPRLRKHVSDKGVASAEWARLEKEADRRIEAALAAAEAKAAPDTASVSTHVFAEADRPALIGGMAAEGVAPAKGADTPAPTGKRINMVTAIRMTLDHELAVNSRIAVFGEDVGPKGGVHAVTMGLQEKYGTERVFDTSLSEEGIIGRAVGMAMAGLVPVPEIQFRKYAEPATEQINDCGTVRWRTDNRFSAPMVIRMPGGFFKCGDPWHSQMNEVQWLHSIGWKLAMPSNAEDAVGLLRSAMRGDDPVIFFEHRNMLDAMSARRPYPGDDYTLPFGRARKVTPGERLTVVTWGAMVERCETAALAENGRVEVIDLRTLSPWDKDAVLSSVRRTGRCLIVHEDTMTAGFGAEISATVTEEVFLDLDAPVRRLTMPDVPSPHSPVLLNAVVPSVDDIRAAITELLEF